MIIYALFRQVFTKTNLAKIIKRKERQRKMAEGTPSSDDIQYKKHDLCSNMSEEIPICLICGKGFELKILELMGLIVLHRFKIYIFVVKLQSKPKTWR